jgi:hypothetical protein
MLTMNRPRSTSPEFPSRRFLLLPEDGAPQAAQQSKVRRYRLASIGRRADLSGTDLATARIAGEFGRMRRSFG